MPVLVKLNVLHIPDRCTCEHHKNKTFICTGREIVFGSHKTALEHLGKWNKQQGKDACWVHEVTSIESADGRPVEFY